MTEARMRDFETFRRGLHSYEWLGDVVSGATDVDCLIERRARFLVVEAKHWQHGIRVPIGQDIVLRQLDRMRAHQPDCTASCSCGDYRPFTVYLVGEEVVGADEDADTFHVMRFGRAVPTHRTLYPSPLFERATRDDLRQLVRLWEQEA